MYPRPLLILRSASKNIEKSCFEDFCWDQVLAVCVCVSSWFDIACRIAEEIEQKRLEKKKKEEQEQRRKDEEKRYAELTNQVDRAPNS